MSALRGYVCAGIAALLYGVQYSPVKAYPVYDGSKFQWFMSTGIAFSGLVAALVMSTEQLVVIPYGILGGALWGTANVLVIPTVKFLGLGVGFAMYHSINMAVGYAIGRFGLFGAPREAATHPLLRDAGLWLLILSLIFMIFVEPEIVDPEEDDGASNSRSPTPPSLNEAARRTKLVASLTAETSDGSSPRPERTMSVDQIEELSVHASAKEARQGYMNWRRGAAKGSVEKSSGVVGVRSKRMKARIVKQIKTLFPLYDTGGARVRSHYRAMISSKLHDIAASARDIEEARPSAAPPPGEGSTLLDQQIQSVSPAESVGETTAKSRRRTIFGTVFGIFAGLLCGVNMLPYVLYLKGQDDLTFNDTLSFFFSQCFGVFVAATSFLALFAFAARFMMVELKSPAVWPAWTAGTLWSAGFLLAAVAVEDLGMAQAYTYDAIGPVMISACISFVCGEIVGCKNTILFLTALVLQALGVMSIAAGA